jgi:hypothetical protein
LLSNAADRVLAIQALEKQLKKQVWRRMAERLPPGQRASNLCMRPIWNDFHMLLEVNWYGENTKVARRDWSLYDKNGEE